MSAHEDEDLVAIQRLLDEEVARRRKIRDGDIATPRKWVGCVVGVALRWQYFGVHTVLRAWRGKRTGRLTRVVLADGDDRSAEAAWQVLAVVTVPGGPHPRRTILLGERL